MRIQINGESRELPDRSTLEDVVRELSLQPQRIAIELNHMVIRRDEWAATILGEGDRIEVVHFVGGGCQSPGAEIGRGRVVISRPTFCFIRTGCRVIHISTRK